jgi:hypothetical protein
MNRMLGGVYVNDVQNNPLQPDINYRGYTASPLLGTPQGLSVYMDGVRLNQPFGDVVSWDLIPINAISRVDIIPGSNPLYGLNTLGAVSGVFLATFALLPGLGVRGASFAGAGMYLAVGAFALWLARRAPAAETPSEPQRAEARAALARWNPALLAYGTVGFTSLVYEVAWTRALSMVVGSSIYAFASMLAAFLLGIGLGSLAAQRMADRLRRPLVAYAVGIAVLGVLSLLSLSLLPHLPRVFMALVRNFGASSLLLFLSQIAVSIAVMFPPAFVLGALFPLLARAQTDAEGAAPAVGDVYFVNTVGSATGAFSPFSCCCPRWPARHGGACDRGEPCGRRRAAAVARQRATAAPARARGGAGAARAGHRAASARARRERAGAERLRGRAHLRRLA